MIPIKLRLACLALGLIPLATQAAESHVHGEARLDIAIDGSTLTLMLEAPADSLLGFEHAPRNTRERAALARTKQTLERPAALFVPSTAAACTARSTELKSPLFETSADHNHGHDSSGAHEHGHADIDAMFVFQCTRPEALRTLDVRLFAAFPRLKKLQVELAGPRGQTALRLTPQQTQVRW
ncbi:MAG: DUF2796 domain-containing protein [Pseudomonadota bacterium]